MTRFLAVLCLAVLSPGVAQQDSLMREAVRLATEGQGDSARALVRAQLRALSPTDSLYPQVLFTAGLVADDADSAKTYYRRVGIEHSRSAWADRALLRLAQLSYAEGDLTAAITTADRLLTDYPFSEVRAGAAFTVARAYLDQRNVDEACRYLQRAEQEAGEDVELSNRAAFYLQRCTEATGEQTPRPTTPAQFSVQVAAVSSVAAADEVMRGLRQEGYTARVIRDGDLLKIRVGRYETRAEAEAVARELKDRIGGSPFVVEGS